MMSPAARAPRRLAPGRPPDVSPGRSPPGRRARPAGEVRAAPMRFQALIVASWATRAAASSGLKAAVTAFHTSSETASGCAVTASA